jgi:hypothetical protein
MLIVGAAHTDNKAQPGLPVNRSDSASAPCWWQDSLDWSLQDSAEQFAPFGKPRQRFV